MSESYISGVTFFFFALGVVLLIAYLPLRFSMNSGFSGKLLVTAAISFISGFYVQYQNGLQVVDYELALFLISCAIAMWVSNFAVYNYGSGIDLFVEDRGLGDFSSFLRKTIKATVFVVPFVLVVNVLMQILFVSFKVDVDDEGNLVRASLIEHLGTFGDFFGGTLTPILTFVSIVLLLMTIRQTQSANKLSGEMLDQATKQLDITAREFERARLEHERTANALQEQERNQRIQQFENAYFTMLDRILSEQTNIRGAQEELLSLISVKVDEFSVESICNILLHTDGRVSKLNIMMYQLFKLIENDFPYYKVDDFLFGNTLEDFEAAKISASTENNKIKRRYYRQFRSFISDITLFYMFVNCSPVNVSFGKAFVDYNNFVTNSSFFEHLDFRVVIDLLNSYRVEVERELKSTESRFDELIEEVGSGGEIDQLDKDIKTMEAILATAPSKNDYIVTIKSFFDSYGPDSRAFGNSVYTKYLKQS
ncbi:hypothetical protein [Oceanospirillum linum]|uniref:Uncharacterized protein n=1 Tax=Oceanospirillum linum TaxID=966 RepID=A0A1T1H8Y7_OCELI|nr:hypothetical protein [Oceanospirillum linum]OOV86302.1 hypothetical protein BTA35_0213880 [Oceanospirillum linum]SEG47171.1 hypothetical protein SAMN04489856_11225 [Oleiphilus messinensis]SMP30948.1 hypothetical protein SAMN06264348_10842 [Oceanospirillum linum]